jgi:predicted ribosome quality control (RQC) complex YloA/Tae2 family protein
LFTAFEEGRTILENMSDSRGFITATKQSNTAKQPETEKIQTESGEEPIFYDQFHPSVLLKSFESERIFEFESFDEAVDDFFSKIESQKLDMKQLQQVKY